MEIPDNVTTLFVCGEPDLRDPRDPLAAFEGRTGAVLLAMSSENGERLAQYTLDCPPYSIA